MSDRIRLVEDGDDDSKFGQRPLTTSGPRIPLEERGQQVVQEGGQPWAAQDPSKLILPEMPLPPELPPDEG